LLWLAVFGPRTVRLLGILIAVDCSARARMQEGTERF